VRVDFLATILVALPLIGGCSAVGGRQPWEQANGGLIRDAHEQRAQAAFALLGLPNATQVHVHVLNCNAVGAYGWPDGAVFVTRGLVDLLDQQELAAAIAHEAGHLLDGGHVRSVVSLRGCTDDPDAEVRADAIGVRLLEHGGIARHEMVSMLQKVCASTDAPSLCRPAMLRRLAVLSAAYESAPASFESSRSNFSERD
jgi:Zn-dependent protease with chaperone function